MSEKIVVTGGSGFIGSEICRQAIEQGHNVVSISRSGRPHTHEVWADHVQWVAANVLEPESWREHLGGAHAVIHCVGGFREHPGGGETLERINDDSTEVVAWEAEHAGVPQFVFLSAGVKPPMISSRFLQAKRQAETALRGRQIHESILRPTLVYGPGRLSSTAVARAMQLAEKVPGVGMKVRPMRPVHVKKVAAAALRAALEPGFEGVISTDNIEYLSADQPLHHGDGMPPTAGRRLSPVLIGSIAAGVVAVAAGALLYRRRSKSSLPKSSSWKAMARYMPSRSS